jgi:hypothetical protein
VAASNRSRRNRAEPINRVHKPRADRALPAPGDGPTTADARSRTNSRHPHRARTERQHVLPVCQTTPLSPRCTSIPTLPPPKHCSLNALRPARWCRGQRTQLQRICPTRSSVSPTPSARWRGCWNSRCRASLSTTDGHGRIARFGRTIVVLTSNVGAADPSKPIAFSTAQLHVTPQVIAAVRATNCVHRPTRQERWTQYECRWAAPT